MTEYHWYTSPVVLTAIMLGCALQLLIARRLPDGPHVLRSHAFFAAVGVILTALGHWLPALGPADGVDLLSELVKTGWGILLIRILCISLFRIAMPALGAGQARILHELVFVLSSLAWSMVRLRGAGMDLGGIVTTSAAITAIIAFAMQETLGNILGGLALQADKSFQLGDWILVDGTRGKVIEVRWRHTALLTPNGEVVVIPNSLLMKSKVIVVASNDSPIARRTVKFAVPAGVPPHEVIGAVEQALRDADMHHVAHLPVPDCVASEFADGSIHYAVRYWLLDQLHDASADSTVRLHIFSALKRHDFPLSRPVMDVSLEVDPAARDETERAREIELRVRLLADVPLFASLHPDELALVASRLRVAPFMKNDVMTRQGAVAHWLYVLTSGEADVWYEDPDGDRRYVGVIQPGEVFGEMGMMTGAARSATVSARTASTCLRIDKQCFESVLRARPELAGELARIISARHAVLDVVREIPRSVAQEGGDAALLARIRRFFHLPLAN
ncbi:MAG: mechanosensitive ion channel family protein [Pseudomonadota bacterium]